MDAVQAIMEIMAIVDKYDATLLSQDDQMAIMDVIHKVQETVRIEEKEWWTQR